MTETKRALWDRFVDRFVDAADPISLFEAAADGTVDTIAYGRSGRRTLRRGERMERRLREAGGRVVAATFAAAARSPPTRCPWSPTQRFPLMMSATRSRSNSCSSPGISGYGPSLYSGHAPKRSG